MPIVGLLLDTVYNVCAFEFCKDQKEFGIWWFAAARLAWLAVKWIVPPVKSSASSRRVLPQLHDFTLDEQKQILEVSGKIPSWVGFPDLERAEWVNTVLVRVWSPFGRYMDKMFKDVLEPIVQSAIGTKFAFRFDKVDFGTIPLRVSGVKGYKENVGRKEIVMDWEIYYSGDAELTVHVFGVKAGVKNIQLRGTMRVVLKPVLMNMPFLGGVEFYFLNPPVVDFEMTNLLNAPGFSVLKQTVHQQVMDNLKWILVLPNKFSMPFTEDISYKNFLFDLPAGMLRVHVIGGKNLPIADIALVGTGSSDPYIKLRLGAKEVRTKTKLKTINPTWDEVYDFIVSEPQGQQLNLDLFDEDVGQDDFLGNVSIDSGQVRTGKEPSVHWYNISGGTRGQVSLKLSWFELSADKTDMAASLYENKLLSQYAADSSLTSAVLLVLVDSAERLPSVVAAGKDRDPNASAILSVGHQTFTTRTIPHTSSPIWEQQNFFYVHNPLTENLIVLIKDNTAILPLGSLQFSLANLLEADNFAVEYPFPLKNAGPNSTVQLRLVLRICTNSEVRTSFLNANTRSALMHLSSITLLPPAFAGSTDIPKFDEDGSLLNKTRPLNPVTAEFRTIPRINVTLTYRARDSTLTVEVIEARSLDILWNALKHAREKVFIQCSVLPGKQKEHTGEGSSVDNPTFREKFDFKLGSKVDLRKCTLDVKVLWGTHLFGELLGEVKVPLKFLNLSDKLQNWYELNPKGAGGSSLTVVSVPSASAMGKVPSTSSTTKVRTSSTPVATVIVLQTPSSTLPKIPSTSSKT